MPKKESFVSLHRIMRNRIIWSDVVSPRHRIHITDTMIYKRPTTMPAGNSIVRSSSVLQRLLIPLPSIHTY